MTRTIGLIPAAGSAFRFGGLSKELLPVSQTDCGLTRTIRAMQSGGADEIHIATRSDKTVQIWRVVGDCPGVRLTTREFRGLWEFVANIGETVTADRYYFAMPDTVFPLDAFAREWTGDVTAGVFHTDKPGRFGILQDGQIIDKDPDLTGPAWGVWVWSRRAMEYLISAMRLTRDHTEGLNSLLSEFGLQTFEMDYYYDFAAFDDYREFLCSLT